MVEYNVESGNWKIVTPMVIAKDGQGPRYVTVADWFEQGKTLLIKHENDGKQVSAVEYTFEGEILTQRDVATSIEVAKPKLKNLTVQLRQNANDPPVIVASDGTRERALTGPDPALYGKQIAPQRPYSWQENGKAVTGGLTLPYGWIRERRLPLVIQTYHYKPDLFLPDGVNTTSDAAQALAARGMAVFQVDTVIGDVRDAGYFKTEGPHFAARIDSIVEALDRDGIIDASRVGLTGFSRMGYLTYWTITHPGKTRLAASISADSFDGSYATYLRFAGTLGLDAGEGLEQLGEMGPFWQNKNKWLEYETTFNVDRVVTPALFTYNNTRGHTDVYSGAAYLFQNYGAFNLNKKPMEILLFPEAVHQLKRPRERLEMMTAVVDWYCYWLKGEIPPDPERAKRWDRLRKMQEAVLADLAAKGEKVAPLPPLVPAPSWVKALSADSFTATTQP